MFLVTNRFALCNPARRKASAMAKIDQLRKMKLPELLRMRDDISVIIQEKQTIAKDEFRKEMEEKARAHGFDLGELFGVRSKRGPKKTVPRQSNTVILRTRKTHGLGADVQQSG